MGILTIDPERHRNSAGRGPIYYFILIAIGIALFISSVGITALDKQLDIRKLKKEVNALKEQVETYIEETDMNIYFTNDDLEYISDIEKVQSQFENMVLVYDELVRIGTKYSVTYAYMEFDTIKNQVTFEILIADTTALSGFLMDIRESQYFTGYNPDYEQSGSPINTKIVAYYSESASRG